MRLPRLRLVRLCLLVIVSAGALAGTALRAQAPTPTETFTAYRAALASATSYADLLPFMADLRKLGSALAADLIAALGKENIEAYGKAAIVGVNGEIEHGAVWHEAGGWALRAALGEPKAIVPAAKAVASAGYRLMMPLHHIHAAYVRSHFNSIEVGLQDAPRPDEILFALAAADGGRIHSRLGGLTKDQISVGDGQR